MTRSLENEVGFWTCDGDALACSESLAAILGETPATLDVLLARVHDGDRAELARAIATRAPFELEHRIVRPGGALRIVHARAQRLGGRLVVAVEDITDHQTRMAELAFADRMQAVATLAGGLAHEINNPLAFIAFNLDAVQQELRAPRGTDRWGELDAMLGEAREGVDRIQRIVRGIALFARKTEDHRARVELVPLLDRALDTTSTDLRQRARVVRAYGEVPAVRANETRLVQVFVNLLQNAAAAIPEGAADRHEIRITTRSDEARAIVEISDTGHGMPPGEQERIFEPFYTTKAIGGGIGLGLSICHGIVRALGGEIAVQSAIGSGTTVRVTLPGEPHAAPAPTRTRATASPTRRGRVLIVDDEVVFANSLRRLMARDHEVVAMNRGRDVLASITSGVRYDAILCDLMMPEMTGMELHARLLDLAPDQADRMIFVTGGAFTDAAQRFIERLRTPWFEKPCNVSDLRAAVAALIT